MNLDLVGVMKAVEDYEALAQDPDVDIVYVSNIHPAHKDASILMMDHGKHVLCEKPLAVSPCSVRLCWSDQKALSALILSQCTSVQCSCMLPSVYLRCMLFTQMLGFPGSAIICAVQGHVSLYLLMPKLLQY